MALLLFHAHLPILALALTILLTVTFFFTYQ